MFSKQQETSNTENFRRDCSNRTYSERQLDKFILKQERKDIKEAKEASEDQILKKMKLLDKTAAFSVKKVEEKQPEVQKQETVQKQSQQQENQQQEKQQQQSVQIKDALIKVCKHLSNEAKGIKALGMLHKLVEKHNMHISMEHRLDIIFQILENRAFYKRIEMRKAVAEIYGFLCKPNKKFEERYASQLEILKVYFVDTMELETDDSFAFNNMVNKRYQPLVDGLFNEEQKIKQIEAGKNVQQQIQAEIQEKKEEDKKSSAVMSIRDRLNKKKQEELKKKQEEEIQDPELPEYEYQVSENCCKFIDVSGKEIENLKYQFRYKQDLVIDIFADFLKYYKNQWARGTINKIYADIVFDKKFMFPEDLQVKIDDYADKWMSLKNEQSALNTKRDQIDGKIQSAGTSRHEVQDARTVKYIVDNGANTWGNKQNGL